MRRHPSRHYPYALLTLTLAALALLLSYRLVAQSSNADVAMVTPTGEATGYWPRWRGPSGQGLAMDSGYLDTWSDKQNILWRTEVPGRGHSSPIVWADRIFLTTGYSDRIAAAGAEGHPVISKPYRLETISDAIEHALTGQRSATA